VPTIEIRGRRLSVVSARPFAEVVAALGVSIGRPDLAAFRDALGAAHTLEELERVVRGAIGVSELMEFARFDVGEVMAKDRGGAAPRSLRLVVGNPLIMKELVRSVPDAASYAPVTILVDERADGVHLSYDTMASLLAGYGSEDALRVAAALDAKVESLLDAAAR
jgi:hypothetical protein